MALKFASTKPTAKYYAFSVAFSSSVVVFFAARAPEIISMSITNPLHGMCVVVSLAALITLFLSPPLLTSSLIRRLGLICLVLFSLKSEMDPALTKLAKLQDLSNSVCIVTGANSGTGYAITELLVERGATVILGCRSVTKCSEASIRIANDIRLRRAKHPDLFMSGQMIVMELDLSDLSSVHTFTSELARKYSRIDVLVNNAGIIAPAGFKTAQGFEGSFGVMHVGHFALTRWLMPLLAKQLPEPELNSNSNGQSMNINPFENGARIVNIGSHAHAFGQFDISLMRSMGGTGDLSSEITDNCKDFGPFGVFNCCPLFKCPVTNGYARAKLANLLHISEIQRRSDLHAVQLARLGLEAPRRIVSSVLHPGSVKTHIHWLIEFSGQFLRSSEQAAHLILHAIQSNSYLPGTYLDSMGTAHDLLDFREDHLAVHLEAFPSVVSSRLPFIQPSGINLFSFDTWSFKSRNLISWQSVGPAPTFDSKEVAARLWEVSEGIVIDWEKSNDIQ